MWPKQISTDTHVRECWRIFTARVRSTTGRYCFRRCLSVHTGGGGFTPSPSHNTSPGPMSFSGGTPVTGPRFLYGGVPHSQMGGTPSQRWGTPPPGQAGGTPPSLDRTADGVLATQWAVCLLRSRRRTVVACNFSPAVFAVVSLCFKKELPAARVLHCIFLRVR